MTEEIKKFYFKKFDKSTTLYVSFKISKEFKIRLWIATKLLTITARILNCNIEINNDINVEI